MDRGNNLRKPFFGSHASEEFLEFQHERHEGLSHKGEPGEEENLLISLEVPGGGTGMEPEVGCI